MRDSILIIVLSLVLVSNSPAQLPAVGLKLMAEGFTAPMELLSAGDGTGRMFLVDQIGEVRVISANDTVLGTPFMDQRDRMVSLDPGYDERGLLGLAFHPDYSKNGRLFVLYNAPLRAEGTRWIRLHHPRI
jgi:hypothetical protein